MDSARLRTLVETVRREGRGVLATTAPDGAPEAGLVGIAIRPEWMREDDVDREPRAIETTFLAR